MNLVEPDSTGPEQVLSFARELSSGTTAEIERCELVGLVPRSVLDRTPLDLWDVLDLSPAKTIETRIIEAGIHP